jgi:Carboxypeptidase regulatory-like domain
MRRALLFTVALFVALLAANNALAAPQSKGSGILSGLVLGPNDKPVANASVTYQSANGSAPHAVRADAHGRFTISSLKADNYDLRASAKGVFSEWEKNVMVRSGQTKSITLRLIYAKEMPKAGAFPTPASTKP